MKLPNHFKLWFVYRPGQVVRHIVFEDHVGPAGPVCEFLAGLGYDLFEVGWRLAGPVLAPPGSGLHRPYEAPSYLATRDCDGALARCRPRGWVCFRKPRGKPSRYPA